MTRPASFAFQIAFTAVILARPSFTIAATTNNQVDATLRVQAVRIARSTTEVMADFGGRAYSDIPPGTSLQFLITISRGRLLTPTRDAITIDTFIDDTYQNLAGGGVNTSYGSQPLTVSEDGRSLLFTVAASRPVAVDAGRVFVRGVLNLQTVTGESLVEAGKLPLFVGQGVKIGPFTTSLRTITSDTGDGGLNLTLAVHGRSNRILKVRVLDSGTAGNVINDPKQTRFSDNAPFNPGDTYRPNTLHVKLNTVVTNAVVVEYTFAENVEPVSVPFEAQVDIGSAKAGPVKASTNKPTQAGTQQRPWPPPPSSETNTAIPPRRPPFSPNTQPEKRAP